MTKEEAYILLSFHSCRNNDIENKKWENGFLGSLRPFQGKIYECNFIEIMECLKVLADDFMKPTINQKQTNKQTKNKQTKKPFRVG